MYLLQYDYVTPQTTLSIDTCFNKGQPDIIKNSERGELLSLVQR